MDNIYYHIESYATSVESLEETSAPAQSESTGIDPYNDAYGFYPDASF